MRVKPAPGLKFRHPETKQLHDEHDVIEVADGNLAFAKFLAQGDVVRVADEPITEAE